MFFTFLVVVVLTAIALVAAAMTIAKLIAPRSFNPQKGEPYECGIPTRGQSWVQFKVGYYLYAILFLMFDIETVFLFPWAVTAGELGSSALVCGILFLVILYWPQPCGGKERWNGNKETRHTFDEIRRVQEQ